MATTTIPWGDGSGDNIYLTYTSASGNQTVEVTSDANAGPARTKDITFVSTVGNIARVLTVIQETNMSYVSITWNDTCITFNDTGIAYPYVEPYIVFVDPVVEQICATKWGDGTGLKPSQAAQVTNAQFGTTFQGNTDITSFEEFAYFTSVTEIAFGAFNGCSSIERIVLPSSVVNLYRSFQNCTSLKYLELPDGISIPYNNAFTNCSSLEEITFRGTYSGGGYTFAGTAITRVNIQSIDAWASMPVTQTSSVGQYAIEFRLYLIGSDTEITTPTISTSIVDYAFYRCIGFTSVTIGATATTIGASAFALCTNLASVYISSGVTTIGTKTFDTCTSLTFVDMPETITTINAQAFLYAGTAANKCTYILRSTTPPELVNANAFVAARTNKIYVPSGTLSAYQTASNWSNFASYMAELDANGNIPT